MAMRVETNPLEAAHAVLLENGLDGAGEALRIMVNEAAKIERDAFIGARPYERTEPRRDCANGFNPKTLLTQHGELTFQVPHVRSGNFSPSVLEKGTRTDRAVNLAFEHDVCHGRLYPACHRCPAARARPSPLAFQHLKISRATETLDKELAAWRKEHPKLAEWAETAITASLTVFDFPAAHRIRLRTTRPYTHQPRAAPTHPPGQPLPQPGFLPAPRLRSPRRTRRRVRPTRSISTSTCNPDVMTTDRKFTEKRLHNRFLMILDRKAIDY